MSKKPIIIAEVKPQTPDGKIIGYWDDLFGIAKTVGDWISIHTNILWGGSFSLVSRARSLTEKPILAKGLHRTDDDVERAIDSGADYVLVVDRIPKVHEDKCLVEMSELQDLLGLPKHFKRVWNARDLRALLAHRPPEVRVPIQDVRELCPDAWLCQASHIRSPWDIWPEVDAVIVGTHLREFAHSLP